MKCQDREVITVKTKIAYNIFQIADWRPQYGIWLILEQWRIITKEKQAAIVVIDMPLLDTRRNKDLTGTLIADIVLQLLSYVAQTEREFIHQRQAEGIAAARQQGVKFGRKPMERPLEYKILKEQWWRGEISARKAAKQLGITHRTFLLWVNENTDGCVVRNAANSGYKRTVVAERRTDAGKDCFYIFGEPQSNGGKDLS